MMGNIKIVISHSLLSMNKCWDLLGWLGRGVRDESSEPAGCGEGAPSTESHRGGRKDTYSTVYTAHSVTVIGWSLYPGNPAKLQETFQKKSREFELYFYLGVKIQRHFENYN